MKIREMPTDRAFECMARMVPFFTEIGRDPKVVEAKRKLIDIGKDDATMTDVIDAVMPVILTRHRETLYGVLALIGDRKPEEIASQPYEETVAMIRGDLNKEFFDFLSFASRLVMNA